MQGHRRAWVLFGLVIIVSCACSQSSRTTDFALDIHVDPKLVDLCLTSPSVGDGTTNGKKLSWRRWCELTLDPDRKTVLGNAMFEFEGHLYNGGYLCGLHVGPVSVTGPVPPTILANFIDDPTLARQIDAKLAQIDITKEYAYQERVAGFQLDVVQQGVRKRGVHSDLVVDLRMNGCDQDPDTSPVVMTSGRPVVRDGAPR